MASSRVRWLALLPASKGVTEGGRGAAWTDVASPEALAVTRAHSDADDLLAAPTRPARDRYDGVVHRSSALDTLDPPGRRRHARHVAYVSALAGLVRATEPLPAYRLEMAAKLEPVGGLAAYWRPHVTAALDAALAPGARVWMLTGGEYARAVIVPDGRRTVDVAFVETAATGEKSLPSATVKQARGQLARALVDHPDIARHPDHDRWGDVRLTAAGRILALREATADAQTWTWV